jgi:hypothetical protein
MEGEERGSLASYFAGENFLTVSFFPTDKLHTGDAHVTISFRSAGVYGYSVKNDV